jgi:hypothetical protein
LVEGMRRKSMKMSDTPLAPLLTLNSTWLSAGSKISGVFSLQYIVMRVRKILIPGISFQVLLMIQLIHNTKFTCSPWICDDEIMCSWRPKTTALGGLPNISFVVQKPEPLGKLFLNKLFYITTKLF